MLKKILIGLVVLILALLAVGMVLPRHVHVERSATIDLPQANLYALLDGFKQFNAWSPWHAMDPQAAYSTSGPADGVGAKMSWDGKTIKQGSQEIVGVHAPDTIDIKLDFPGQAPAAVKYALAPEGSGTKFTWSMDCDMGAGPVGRYFGLVMGKMVGGQFEQGLASLNALAAKMPKADLAGFAPERVTTTPMTVAYVATSSSQDPKEIAGAIGAAFMKIGPFAKQNGLKQAGPVMTIDRSWADGKYEFDAAVPVDRAPDKPVPADSAVQIKQTYAGPVLKVVHKGSYAAMPQTYEKLRAFMAIEGLEKGGDPWDEYVSDPGNTPEADLVTNIVQPLK